jgi:beta-lactamase regulating signal transducer with metallopeptidase domain
METTLNFWWRFGAMLALELGVVAAVALAAQHLVRRALWNRLIWQVCLIAMLVVLAIELSGVRGLLAAQLFTPEKGRQIEIPEKAVSFLVTISEPAAAITGSQPALHSDTAGRGPAGTLWWPGIVWATVSGLLLLRAALVRLLFIMRARTRRAFCDPELLTRIDELARRLGIRTGVRVMEIDGLRGPIAFGMVRPAVGLPPNFTRLFGPNEQDAMLVHELAHLAGRDVIWYWLADVFGALLWWHPLTWLVRRRLHAATETAADEASLLIKDGPATLAEVLVTLGGRLLQPENAALPGIGGGGFRSGLGRRVEQLMRLERREWRPLGAIRSWTVRTAGLLTIVGATICCSAWALPDANTQTSGNAWQDSVAGRAVGDVVNALRAPKVIQVAQTDPANVSVTPAVQSTNNTALYTRAFKVDPQTFIKGLEATRKSRDQRSEPENFKGPVWEAPPRRADPNSALPDRQTPGIRHLALADNTREQVDLLRERFLSMGVNLQPPKALFFNDRLGMLMVRAPLDELDAIEKIVQALNVPPPQVTIDVKIVEMPMAAWKALGFDWLGTSVASTLGTNRPGDPFVDMKSATTGYATVLTPPQEQVMNRAMQQRSGIAILAAPRITTLSARQAQIKVVEVKTVIIGTKANPANPPGVSDLVTTNYEIGPVVDVVPMVTADGYTIELTVIAASREFLGYESTAETVRVSSEDGGITLVPKPLPRFRIVQAMGNPVVGDGQTFVMGLGRFSQEAGGRLLRWSELRL